MEMEPHSKLSEVKQEPENLPEYYADFVAGDPYYFTLNMASNHLCMIPVVVDPSSLQRFSDRVVDGIAAVFVKLQALNFTLLYERLQNQTQYL